VWPVIVAATLSIAAGGEPPLVSAVKAGKVDTVRALLTQRADANSAEVDGTTALHYAAHFDNLAAADLLIKAGANVRAANRYGATPLWLACTNGSASSPLVAVNTFRFSYTRVRCSILSSLGSSSTISTVGMFYLFLHRAA
jgi:hypothetical protein